MDVANELRECAEDASFFSSSCRDNVIIIKVVLCAKSWNYKHEQVTSTTKSMVIYSIRPFSFFLEKTKTNGADQQARAPQGEGPGWLEHSQLPACIKNLGPEKKKSTKALSFGQP